MRRVSCVVFLIIMAYAKPILAQPKLLDDKGQIQDALKLHHALDAVSSKVTACMDEGDRDLATCQCSAQGEIETLRSGYNSLIEAYPSWDGEQIGIPKEPMTVTINMNGLKRALESRLSNVCDADR